MLAEELRGPSGWIGCGRDTEEWLHFAGGGEGDEHAAGLGVAAGKGVRNTAGTDNRFAGDELFADVSDLKYNLALEDVEILFLSDVVVEGRAAFDQVLVLDNEEAAVGFLGQDLEEDGAKAARAMLAEAVVAGGDNVHIIWRCRGGLGEG